MMNHKEFNRNISGYKNNGYQFEEYQTDFEGFIDDSIELLLRSERSFIICERDGIPLTLFKKDDAGDIWIALINEIQNIYNC